MKVYAKKKQIHRHRKLVTKKERRGEGQFRVMGLIDTNYNE